MSTITGSRAAPGFLTRFASGFAVALAAGLAASVGLGVGEPSKGAVVLPLAVAGALALVCLSLMHFSAYVAVMLLVRSSVDLGRLSDASGGPVARILNPSSIFAVVFIVAAVAWIAAQRDHWGPVRGSGLRAALLVFVGAAALSTVGSRDAVNSTVETVRILAAVMMFVVVEQLARDPRRMRTILVAVYGSLVVPLGLVAVGFLTGGPRTEEKGGFIRIIGPFAQSNVFGRYLMLLLVMGVAIYPHVEGRARRLLGAVLVGSAISLLLTYTRSALIGAVLGIVVIGLYHNRRVLGGLVVVGVVAALVVPGIAARFAELGSESPNDPNPGNSLQWRLGYWTDVLPLASRNPATGIGVGQTQFFTEKQVQPHNDFLRAYVETGIVGLIAYITMLAMLVRTGRKAVRSSAPHTLERGIAVGFLGCVTAFVAASAVSNVFSNVVSLWYFFAFAGAAAAIVHRAERPAPALGVS
jgi:putative inorganic carbon (hco3(-)) transporter